jgi:hypothetical protein
MPPAPAPFRPGTQPKDSHHLQWNTVRGTVLHHILVIGREEIRPRQPLEVGGVPIPPLHEELWCSCGGICAMPLDLIHQPLVRGNLQGGCLATEVEEW